MPFRRILAMLLLTTLAGCASGASSHNMTASLQPALAISPSSLFYQSMEINAVTGGSETNPLVSSQVSDRDFKVALKNSLHQNRLFAVGPEKYLVVAEIKEVDQPIIGLDASVTSKVRYKITRVSDKAVIYDKVVTATYTAAFGDTFLGVERLRLANEGSIKKNITSFIAEVSKATA